MPLRKRLLKCLRDARGLGEFRLPKRCGPRLCQFTRRPRQLSATQSLVEAHPFALERDPSRVQLYQPRLLLDGGLFADRLALPLEPDRVIDQRALVVERALLEHVLGSRESLLRDRLLVELALDPDEFEFPIGFALREQLLKPGLLASVARGDEVVLRVLQLALPIGIALRGCCRDVLRELLRVAQRRDELLLIGQFLLDLRAALRVERVDRALLAVQGIEDLEALLQLLHARFGGGEVAIHRIGRQPDTDGRARGETAEVVRGRAPGLVPQLGELRELRLTIAQRPVERLSDDACCLFLAALRLERADVLVDRWRQEVVLPREVDSRAGGIACDVREIRRDLLGRLAGEALQAARGFDQRIQRARPDLACADERLSDVARRAYAHARAGADVRGEIVEPSRCDAGEVAGQRDRLRELLAPLPAMIGRDCVHPDRRRRRSDHGDLRRDQRSDRANGVADAAKGAR